MENEKIVEPYKIVNLNGFPPALSHLICMMTQTRTSTLASVGNLNMYELDFLLDSESNSIGALLSHMAAVEKWYQELTFNNKEITGEEFDSIEAALDLGEKARREIKGNELAFYLNELKITRDKTIRGFRNLNEDWLWQEHFFANSKANNYYLWFHVIEDEINHRGQINLIKKRIR